MTDAPTPAVTASHAVSSFGIIPPLIVPSATRRDTSSVHNDRISSPLRSRTPTTSVSSSNRAAPSAAATAPAAVSALMLYDWPSVTPTPIGAMTGMAPHATRSSSSAGRTCVGSPTSPRSARTLPPEASVVQCSRRVAPITPAAWPVRPTALPPARESALTSLLFTSPPSTISTTSIVRSSVTRRPSTKLDCTPKSFSIPEICGPPPCTITTLTPRRRSRTTSA
mmetsp:Transcript_8874/g.27883  ORF Transcript_8874/g.27883 Transcript_8874/m.27883 type:complete len:224 (+) Transcript_8874:957-1628(+)